MYKNPNPHSEVPEPTYKLTPEPPKPQPSSTQIGDAGSQGRELPSPTRVLTK